MLADGPRGAWAETAHDEAHARATGYSRIACRNLAIDRRIRCGRRNKVWPTGAGSSSRGSDDWQPVCLAWRLSSNTMDVSLRVGRSRRVGALRQAEIFKHDKAAVNDQPRLCTLAHRRCRHPHLDGWLGAVDRVDGHVFIERTWRQIEVRGCLVEGLCDGAEARTGDQCGSRVFYNTRVDSARQPDADGKSGATESPARSARRLVGHDRCDAGQSWRTTCPHAHTETQAGMV